MQNELLLTESLRLAQLYELGILDTPPEPRFDRITRFATRLFDVPIALISLIDQDRQWFKSRQGLDITETARILAFCDKTILSSELMVVEDACQDTRFADNLLVCGTLGIRFYAGCALAIDGHRIGTFCIIDQKPRCLSEEDKTFLREFAEWVQYELNNTLSLNALDTLSQTELHFHDFLDSASELAQSVSPEGEFIYVNRAWMETLGYNDQDITHLSLFDIIHPSSHENFREVYLGVLSSSAAHDIEANFVTKSGECLALAGNINCLQRNGKAVLTRGIFHNITQQKNMESALRLSHDELERRVHERTQALVTANETLLAEIAARHQVEQRLHESELQLARVEDFSHVMVTHVGLDGSWLKVPQRLCHWLGYSEEELLNSNFKDITYPEDYAAAWNQCLRLIRGELQSFELEKRYLKKTGETVWAYQNCCIVADQAGTPLYFVTYITDISNRKNAEFLLRESEKKYRDLVETSNDLIWTVDTQGRWTFLNKAAKQIYGYEPEEMLGRPFFEFEVAEQVQKDMEVFKQVLAGKQIFHYETVHQCKDGAPITLLYTAKPLLDEQGQVLGATGTAMDITERKKIEVSLVESENLLRMIFDAEPECVKLVGRDGSLINMNRAGLDMLEVEEIEILKGKCIYPLLSSKYRASFIDLVDRVFNGESGTLEFELLGIKGTRRWLESHAVPLRDAAGNIISMLAVTRDITVHKMHASVLEYQAMHDPLTSLPNRTFLYNSLQQLVTTSRHGNRSFALLLMDLNKFKEINDTLGHHKGDLVLQEMARRLRSMLRESDIVARLGGDEFALLLAGVADDDAAHLARKVLANLQAPLTIDGLRLEIGASIGISLYPVHGLEPEILIQHADVAMYFAKQEDNGYAFYSPEYDQHSKHRLILLGELRQAIEHDQLVLHYQPKIELQGGQVTSLEALVRWEHPQRGLIYPDQFISLAEHSGLIGELLLVVLNNALQQCKVWHALGVDLPVAINLSVRNLHDRQLPDQIIQLLRKYDLPAERLEVEITESVIMSDPPRTMEVLTRLSNMGIRLAIDDFGIGYSSLGYLKKLPVDEIKIDKSFVIGMATDRDDAAIVRSTVELAHNLGLKVVAEGVETRELYTMLAALGCDKAQGYYMSRPLPANELITWLNKQPP